MARSIPTSGGTSVPTSAQLIDMFAPSTMDVVNEDTQLRVRERGPKIQRPVVRMAVEVLLATIAPPYKLRAVAEMAGHGFSCTRLDVHPDPTSPGGLVCECTLAKVGSGDRDRIIVFPVGKRDALWMRELGQRGLVES